MTLFELHTYLKSAGFERWGISPARLYSKNNRQQTALEFLCSQFSIEGLAALAITKYKFNHEDAFSGESPIFSIIKSGDHRCIDLLEILFHNNMDINCRDKQGNNALHIADELALKELSMFLVNHDIDYTAKNEKQETPMDVIPEAAEGFMVPAINKAIKGRKKSSLLSMATLSSLLHGESVFQKPKKASL